MRHNNAHKIQGLDARALMEALSDGSHTDFGPDSDPFSVILNAPDELLEALCEAGLIDRGDGYWSVALGWRNRLGGLARALDAVEAYGFQGRS